MTPEQQTEQMMTDVRRQLAAARFDVVAWLRLDGATRAAQWRCWDDATRREVITTYLLHKYGDWSEAHVSELVAQGNARYGDAPTAPEQAILGELEGRLAGAEGREATAVRNALAYFRAGVRPALTPAGAFLLPSQSGGPDHILTRSDGTWDCACKAGEKMHWAIALMDAVEGGIDRLAEWDHEDEHEPIPVAPPPAALGARLAAARRRCQEAA